MSQYISTAPVQIFISSSIDEFRFERNLLNERINSSCELTGYKAWIFEDSPAQSGDTDSLYLGEIDRSLIVFVLLGKEVRGPVIQEVQRAQSLGKQILVFVNDVERTSECTDFLRSLQRHGIHKTWTAFDDLWEHIKDAMEFLTRKGMTDYLVTHPVPPFFGAADTPPPLKELGRELTILCDQGDFDHAIARVYEVKPDSGASPAYEFDNLLGFIYRRQGRFETAKRVYECLYRQTQNERFLINSCVVLLAEGRNEEALEAHQKLSQAAQATPVATVLKAQLLYLNAEYSAALRLLLSVRSVYRRRIEDSDYLALFAHIAGQLHKYVTASNALSRVCAARPAAAPTMWIYAAYYLHQAGIQTDRTDYHVKALSYLEAELPPDNDMFLSHGQTLDEFLSFRFVVHGAILHSLGRSEEAFEVLRSVPDQQQSIMVKYNLQTLGHALFGHSVEPDVMLAAARTSNSPTIWANLLNAKVFKSMNDRAVPDDLPSLLKEFSEAHPGAPECDYYSAALSSITGPYPSGTEDLTTIYKEGKCSKPITLNALQACFCNHANAGQREAAENVLRDAISMELLHTNLLTVAMKLARTGRGVDYSIFEETMRLAQLIPFALTVERRYYGVVSASKVQDLGYFITKAAIGTEKLAEASGVLEEIKQVLPSSMVTAFDGGVAQAIGEM